QPAPVRTTPLTMRNPAAASLATAGAHDRSTFTLPGAALLYFDSLTNSGSFNWTLIGPAGAAVTNRPFFASDSGGLSNAVVPVPAGDYTLTIDGTGDVTGAYAFRLWDVAQATALTPGTPVSGRLSAANENDLYRFTASAGERFFFDVSARTFDGSRWRLVDPDGNVVFSNVFRDTTSSDVDVL